MSSQILPFLLVELMMSVMFVLYMSSWAVVSVLPYFLLFSLICVSFTICILMGAIYSSLLGFLIFMIYVSGVMVLFLYTLSIYPEQRYSYDSFNLWTTLLFTGGGSMMCMVSLNPCEVLSSFEVQLIFHYMSMKGWSSVFLFMVIILFYVMVLVCNICDKKSAPLRAGKLKKMYH